MFEGFEMFEELVVSCRLSVKDGLGIGEIILMH